MPRSSRRSSSQCAPVWVAVTGCPCPAGGRLAYIIDALALSFSEVHPMDTIEQPKKSGVEQGMKAVKGFRSTTPYAPGRRSFFQYRDLGVEPATNGRMRAVQNNSIAGMTQPTGWHYHDCEMQFVYVLKGTLTIEFEDGTVGTFSAGDSFFIPGSMKHNEIYVSAD